MVSSKKERGKQRRAAKSLTAAANAGGNRCHESIVKSIRNGRREVTRHVVRGISGLSFDDSGILSVVLDFLKRCENDTFDKVMAEVGGNLPSPSSWIGVLIKADELEPSCRMQIAQNIGPLVRCMCNDTKRVFFNNKKHWRESIVTFVDLVTRMIDRFNSKQDDENKMIVDTLLLHDGLLRSILQWGFWGVENRPDITRELKIDDSAIIVKWGRKAIEQLVTLVRGEIYMDVDGSLILTDEAKKLLDTIGTTPIVSQEYDSNCMVSYTAGLIRIMKTDGWTINDVVNVLSLIRADCVDKGVITEVIDFGFNYTANYDTAVNVTRVASNVIMKESNVENWIVLSDTRVAFAIRSGLIEMCLSFMDKFATHESFRNDDEQHTSLSRNIGTIFRRVYYISLHMKSAKAIESKKKCIEDKLIQQGKNKEITNSVKCMELLNIVRTVLDLSNGAYCCRCNKSLGKKDMKRCNGCNCVTYCSKACQKEDWLNGHNGTCTKSYIDEQSGQFQGRMWPVIQPESEREAAKLEALEQNVNMIQLKLFLDNSNMILSQASSLGIPLHDCIVLFDLSKCPLTVKVQRYSEFYKSQEESRGFEEGRSKEDIVCMYRSNVYNGELLSLGVSPFMAVQRLFPHEWLSKTLERVSSFT